MHFISDSPIISLQADSEGIFLALAGVARHMSVVATVATPMPITPGCSAAL